jgi:hypothetical protein
MGCASLRPVTDPAGFIAKANPRVVYVTHVSGALLTINDPSVRGDSLRGEWQGASQTLTLPLQQITRVEAVQQDKTKTAVAITGLAAMTAAIAYLISRPASDIKRPCNADGATQFGGCDNPR